MSARRDELRDALRTFYCAMLEDHEMWFSELAEDVLPVVEEWLQKHDRAWIDRKRRGRKR